MTKFFTIFSLTIGLVFILPQVAAETASAVQSSTKIKTTKKAPPKKKTIKKTITKKKPTTNKKGVALTSTGMSSTYYNCEQGNKLTVLTKQNETQQVTLRWHNRLYKLLRVSTTTGSHRFEDADSGLVWIVIPSKGILLDAHKGQQLANECKDASIKAAPSQPI